MIYIRFGFVSFLSFVVITLTGCAFNTREVTLRNSEIDQSGSPKKVHTICFNGLRDNRPDTAIGHVQNGYGAQTAKVISLVSMSRMTGM
jgi:hypothetical protein